MRKTLKILACVLFVAGCAATATHQMAPKAAPSQQPVSGREFSRPTEKDVTLGQSTTAQIRERFGDPMSQKKVTVTKATTSGAKSMYEAAPMDGTLTLYNYFLGQSQGASPNQAVGAKIASFVFLDDKLYHYDFVSNFAQGGTAVDETKIKQLVRRKTTKAEVIALFGEPSGHAIYPMVLLPGTEKLIYLALNIDAVHKEVEHKYLEILFDRSGTMVDYRFSSETDAMVPQQVAQNAATP